MPTLKSTTGFLLRSHQTVGSRNRVKWNISSWLRTDDGKRIVLIHQKAIARWNWYVPVQSVNSSWEESPLGSGIRQRLGQTDTCGSVRNLSPLVSVYILASFS